MPDSDDNDGDGEGQVDEEDPSPRRHLHQPPAHERSGGPADTRHPRPGADRAGPVLGSERRLQDGEAAGGEEGAADALQRPGGDQRLDVGRQAAQQRREGEPHDADDEDAPPAEPVAERAAEQDHRGEGERVGVDGPGEARQTGSERVPDAWHGDVDDGRVDERERGAENRGGQDPAGPRGPESKPG